MTHETTGPGLTEAEIRALAPALPDNMIRSLHRQRADEGRVLRTAVAYHRQLRDATAESQNRRRAVENRQRLQEGA